MRSNRSLQCCQTAAQRASQEACCASNVQLLMLKHPDEPCPAQSHLMHMLPRLCSSECKPAVPLPIKAGSMCNMLMHTHLPGICPAEA